MNNYMKLCICVNGVLFSIILILAGLDSVQASVNENNESKAMFHEFYEQQYMFVDYTVSTEKNKKLAVATMVSGDDFQIIVNEDKKQQLIDAFTHDLGVEQSISVRIVNDLIAGVSSSQSCIGFRSECGLVPEFYDFVYIPEQTKVIVHVNSKYLKDIKVSQEKYIKREISSDALISSHTVNVSLLDRDSSYKSKMSYQNRSYLGISDLGYLRSEFMVNSEGEYSITDLSLNRVYEDTRISLGYKYSDSAWNDSSYLSDFGISGFMLQLGSDDSMLKESGIDRRIYFNVNRGGRLEVIDEMGRYLISKNIDTGQHYISYSELPKGNYNITIHVYDGDADIYSERVSVYNYNAARSAGFNYMLTGGYYNPDWITTNRYSSNYDGVERYEQPFINGRLSYNFSDGLSVGSGSLATDRDYVVYSGIDLDVNRQFRTSLVVNSYNSRDTSYRLNAYSKNLSLSYYHYSVGDYDNLSFYKMINVNPGERESIAFSFNYNFDEPISYVGTLTHSRFSNSIGEYEYGYDNTTIKNSLYFLNLPLRSKLGLQYDTIFESDKKVQHGFYLSLSIPLYGDSTIYTHSVSGAFDDNRVTRHQDSLSSNLLSTNNLNVNSRVGASYEQNNSDNNTYDFSLSASYHDNYQNVNGYGYMNSKGSNSLSAQYNTNSILTSEEIYFTDKRSSTYFVNRNSSRFNDKNSFLAVVDSRKNGARDKTYTVNNGAGAYPLNEYKEYEFFLDTEASDFYNLGDSRASASSFPGTIIGLQTGLGEVKSIISTFSDINGLPVSDVECVGFGCVSVVDMSGGVYQIRLKPDYAYKIISRKNQCVIPSLEKAENLNFGNNFCMPPFAEGADGLQISMDDHGMKYYYLGKFFNDSNKLKSFLESLKKEQDVELIVKRVDEYEFVFIKSNKNLSDSYKVSMSELMSYALADEFTPYASVGN